MSQTLHVSNIDRQVMTNWLVIFFDGITFQRFYQSVEIGCVSVLDSEITLENNL